MTEEANKDDVIDITETVPKTRKEQAEEGSENARREMAKTLKVRPDSTLGEMGNFAKLREFQEYLDSYNKATETHDTLTLSGLLDVMNLHCESLRVHFINSLIRTGYQLNDNSRWKDIKTAYEALKKDCEGRAPGKTDEDLSKFFCLPNNIMNEVEKILDKLVEFEEKFSINP